MGKTGEELKDRFKRLRGEAKLTQVALANLANVSVQTIKDIEGGRKGAGIKVLQAVANALHISIEELCGEGAPAVERVEKFNSKKALSYFESVPNEVYVLAKEIGPGHKIWKDVKSLLEGAVEDAKPQKSKKA